MRKSSILFSIVVIFLVVMIGAGIWVISSRQAVKPPQRASDEAKSFTMDEVSRHHFRDNCWTVISGNVYDLTNFVHRHPGGNEILRACGIDATTLFKSRETASGQTVGSGTPHSQAAQEQLDQLRIGTLTK